MFCHDEEILEGSYVRSWNLENFSKNRNTVYRENFAPVLFSHFSPSNLRANLNWANSIVYKG